MENRLEHYIWSLPVSSHTLWTISVLQCFINDILGDFLGKVISYTGDIFIYPLNYDSHVNYVHQVLAKLQENQLMKREKCEFYTTKTLFLTFVIDQDGISWDQNKFNAVMKWPTPLSVKNLKRCIDV